MSAKPSGFNWQVLVVIALTWTVILACITLTVYRADECSAKWTRIQGRMTSAMVDLQALKDQTRSLKGTLTEISKLQLLETLVNSPIEKNPELLRTLLKVLRSPERADGKDLNNGDVMRYEQQPSHNNEKSHR